MKNTGVMQEIEQLMAQGNSSRQVIDGRPLSPFRGRGTEHPPGDSRQLEGAGFPWTRRHGLILAEVATSSNGQVVPHMQFQFTDDELPVVEQALKVALQQLRGKTDNPNVRGRALVVICQKYLKSKPLYAAYRERTS